MSERDFGRTAPLLVLLGLAAIPAIAFTGAWQWAETQVPPVTTTTTTVVAPVPSPELTTDLLSYRRHPTPLAEADAAARQAEQEGSIAAQLTSQIGDGSCVSISDAGSEVIAVAPEASVIPASNQKLLVAAVALDALGPHYQFRTELQSLAPFGGVVPGNVYLVGGGDPVLTTDDFADPAVHPAFNTTSLDSLANQLVALGVTTIDGDVVGDGSRYDDEFRVDSWGDDITTSEAGPYDALLVNDGVISPGNYGLDPNRSAARAFLDLLIARGITVTGGAANSPRPADPALTTLALVESRPLTDVLVELLHTSDNNTAELILKEIGYSATGQGTRQAGLDTVRATLDRWQIPTTGVELIDGSGLDRGNRLTCNALVGLLEQSPVAPTLIPLLPVVGRDGTLSDELLGTSAEDRMRAKTGTLTGVKALSGVQPAGDGRPVEFSLVLNGTDVDDPANYQPVWESLVDVISQYPVVVEPDIDKFAPI